MTQKQVEKLKMGDRVKWIGEAEDQQEHTGVVDEVGYAAVRVKWDDGITTSHYFRDKHLCSQIGRV